MSKGTSKKILVQCHLYPFSFNDAVKGPLNVSFLLCLLRVAAFLVFLTITTHGRICRMPSLGGRLGRVVV